MKKFITLIVLLFTFSCVNPSMENGFNKLIESLKQLTASFEAIQVDQITEDMSDIVTNLEYIAEDLDAYMDAMIEYQAATDAYIEATEAYAAAMEAAAQAAQAATDAANGTLEELKALSEAGNKWATIYLQIMGLSQSFSEIQAAVDNMATSEQVQAIAEQLEGMSNDLTLSIQGSDVDGDGIIHSEDRCPLLAGPESNDGCPEGT